MPVFGHALIGLATAVEGVPPAGIPRRQALWIPTIVALAYLPDILGQASSILGHRYWGFEHSLLLAVPLSICVGWLLRGMFALTRRRAFVLALVSLLLHQISDAIFNGVGRVSWPFVLIRPDGGLEQQRSVGLELLVFGGSFAGYFFVRWWQRHDLREQLRQRLADMLSGGHRLPTVLLSGLLAVIAVTHSMTIVRGHQIREASRLRSLKQYDEALAMFERGYRWPKAEKGRMDFVRADIALSRGNRELAEQYYLRSHTANPRYFWCVLGLARFYASSPEPLEVRQAKAEPYLRQLDEHFQHEEAYRYYRPRLAKQLQQAERVPATREAP